jgi:hypothetical protein
MTKEQRLIRLDEKKKGAIRDFKVIYPTLNNDLDFIKAIQQFNERIDKINKEKNILAPELSMFIFNPK